jgi:hypothetical protein
MIGCLDDGEMVLDEQHGMARIDQAIQRFQETLNIP